jgi:hypothetical protein
MKRRDTSHAERIEIIKLHQRGMSLGQIAQRMAMHRDTVKKWWRVYREQGWDGICPRPHGRPKKGLLSSFDPLVRYVALRLKKHHPHWGSEVILLAMSRRPSLKGKRLPSRSALAAYLKPYLGRLRQERPFVQRRATFKAWPVRAVHQCWEIDFKGGEPVGACGPVAPFLVTDALTSAPLTVRVYPESRAGFTFRHLQADLRRVFAYWGLPEAMRMDRDALFVGSARLEWPGTLLLWLVGLGITPIINDPGKPTQNAHVERQGRTWKDHVAVGANYETLEAVQAASEQAWQDRLIALPSRNPACNGHPPLLAHPELASPRRPFAPDREADLFDFECVELYLADWVWPRRVDSGGKISLANQNVYIDQAFRNQTVEIVYDLDAHAFAAYAHDNGHTRIRHFTREVVSPAYIMGLEKPNPMQGGDIN